MAHHPIKKHDLQETIEEWDGERPGERDCLSSEQSKTLEDEIFFFEEDDDGEAKDGAWIQIDIESCVTDDIARGDMQSDSKNNASSDK